MVKNQKKAGKQTPAASSSGSASLNFDALVNALVAVDAQMRAQTSKAVNMGLTARNWLYGAYILLYEQNGADRATYGEQLVDRLSTRLKTTGYAFEPRTLRLFRQFARTYPQIGSALTSIPSQEQEIWQSAIAKSQCEAVESIRQSPIAELTLPGNELLERLSFTALAELVQIDDPLKRAFYEREAVRGGWSVRELRRQIATLLYERTGLSTDKKKGCGGSRQKQSGGVYSGYGHPRSVCL